MKNKSLKLTHSAQETKLVGFELAQNIDKGEQNKSAQVITLRGDLGAGKTTFVLGFLGYFGIKPHAASPTFVIMKKYKINSKLKIKNSKTESIYHLDAYRLRSKKDLDILGFEEILNNPKNIILIEWPDRISGARFINKLSVLFSYGKKEDERIIRFK